MRVALVHFWWVTNRGGEAVCTEILRLFPDADVFVHTRDEAAMAAGLPEGFSGRVHTTFIDRLPGARRHYQRYLPLMPLALERLDLQEYDLVISSESGPAKGVLTRPDALHVCYCHTPMRYLWDLHAEYLRELGPLTRPIFALAAHWLRVWDRASADRVDHFIANSRYVARRIRKFYRRDADVIHPPVSTSRFRRGAGSGAHFVLVGQLVGYKRADIAVDACTRLGLPLKVVGEGEQRAELERRAGPTVEFLGRLPDAELEAVLADSRALLFPGIEDFGIVPVEAMAAGVPVIAHGRGGVLDSVIDGQTGILFPEQNVDSLVEAIERFEALDPRLDPAALAAHARGFDAELFRLRLRERIDELLEAAAAGTSDGAESRG